MQIPTMLAREVPTEIMGGGSAPFADLVRNCDAISWTATGGLPLHRARARTAGNMQKRSISCPMRATHTKVPVVKKPRRSSSKVSTKSATKIGPQDWMSALALKAAASRSDGGASLQLLLHKAKFDERPHLTLTKRAAA
jgi:hypothetical protein